MKIFKPLAPLMAFSMIAVPVNAQETADNKPVQGENTKDRIFTPPVLLALDFDLADVPVKPKPCFTFVRVVVRHMPAMLPAPTLQNMNLIITHHKMLVPCKFV